MGKEVRIAIIDDDEDDFFLISDCIRRIDPSRFIIDWYKNYDEAFVQVRAGNYHLYFVDYFLGAFTGLDLLKEAAASQVDQPIVLLTGLGNKEIDIKAMESGATDYLVKSEINEEKLERCIRYSLERASFLREVKQRELKYRGLFETCKDAVFICDTDLVFLEVNNAARQLFETENGSLANVSLFDLIDDDVQKARIRDLVQIAGKIDDLEIQLRRPNNENRICLLSLYVLEQANNNVVHGIAHDITNLRKAELANLHAEKLEANERLIRILAHEIRNPLNNIILATEQLMPLAEDETESNYLKIIERNSCRINQIIIELLSLAGPRNLDFEPTTLQEVLEESLVRASDRITLHRINVEKTFPEQPVAISGDRNNLAIAFTNILINAVEAMEIEKGKLSITLDNGSRTPQVTIRDNGRGIPQAHLSKLFEPFFTLKKNGMGLGLTAALSIIQSHQASLQVDSKVGEGTQFLISFNQEQ